MKLAELAGQFQYFKGKSSIYTEAFRSWITPASAAGALAKYLGLQSRWAIVVAIIVPLVVETLGYFLGRFLYNHGGVEKEYQLAADRDVFKRESLRLAAETAKETRQTRIALVALYQLLVKRPPPAP